MRKVMIPRYSSRLTVGVFRMARSLWFDQMSVRDMVPPVGLVPSVDDAAGR